MGERVSERACVRVCMPCVRVCLYCAGGGRCRRVLCIVPFFQDPGGITFRFQKKKTVGKPWEKNQPITTATVHEGGGEVGQTSAASHRSGQKSRTTLKRQKKGACSPVFPSRQSFLPPEEHGVRPNKNPTSRFQGWERSFSPFKNKTTQKNPATQLFPPKASQQLPPKEGSDTPPFSAVNVTGQNIRYRWH